MPPAVDHGARRERVAEVAADLIERRGLDAVTFREIAEAAGSSTAIVSHYFADKKDLLRFVYDAASSRARKRLDRELAREDPDLLRALEALLPIDTSSRRDWRVWFAFWGIAVADPQLAVEQRQRVRVTRDAIARLLGNLASQGRIPVGADIDQGARDLLVMVMGLAAQAIFDPGDWPPKRQRAFLAGHIARLGLSREGTELR